MLCYFSTWVSESQSYFRLQFAENILSGEDICVVIASGLCNPSCSSYLPHPEIKLQAWTDGRCFEDFLLGKRTGLARAALTDVGCTNLAQKIDPNLLNDHIHVSGLHAGEQCGPISIQLSCSSNFNVGDVLRVCFPGFTADGETKGLEVSETLSERVQWDADTLCIEVRYGVCVRECSGTYYIILYYIDWFVDCFID